MNELACVHTREEWLMNCLAILRGDFLANGHVVPEKIRVSCSWPSKGALAKKKRIGEAWSSDNSNDQTFEIFISPVLDNGPAVLATLVHEIVHCVVGLSNKHNKVFSHCAKSMGLEGKVTATKTGESLQHRLEDIVSQIGKYPHAELHAVIKDKPQSTRYLKIKCAACGCVARMTRKWLEQVGLPTCGCGSLMLEDDKGEDNA